MFQVNQRFVTHQLLLALVAGLVVALALATALSTPTPVMATAEEPAAEEPAAEAPAEEEPADEEDEEEPTEETPAPEPTPAPTPALTLSTESLTVPEAGGTDTLAVSLNVAPTTDVTITVTSADDTIAKVHKTGGTPASSTTLTFTNANWDTAQTITVTGENDDYDNDPDRVTDLTVAVDSTVSDDAYDGLSKTVQVTAVDDDVARMVINKTSLTVSENSGEETFTIYLGAKPTGNVLIMADNGEYNTARVYISASSTNRGFFTPDNWNVPQEWYVRGINDDIDNPGDKRLTALPIEAKGAIVETVSLPVTVLDDDTVGFYINKTALNPLAENAITDYYSTIYWPGVFSMHLDSKPSADVTVTLASSDETVGALYDLKRNRLNTFTFTPDNWKRGQTLQFLPHNDDVANAGQQRQATITLTASGGDYESHTELIVATVLDDDTLLDTTMTVGSHNCGAVIQMQGYARKSHCSPGEIGTNTFTYNGTEHTITELLHSNMVLVWYLVLAPQLTPEVLNKLNVSIDGEDYSGDWGISSRRLATLHDGLSLNDGDAVRVLISDTGRFITTSDALSVNESGASTTDTFAVKLSRPPTETLSVSVTSADLTAATVLPATLTFTTTNWNTAQSVTVTGVDDGVINTGGERTTAVNLKATSGGYNGITGTVAVTVND